MAVLGAIQPSYLAWIPYFLRMYKSDVFVYLDDVEYSKNSFHNRNRIRTKDGSLLLTVPVSYSGHSSAKIKDMPIAQNQGWARKHLKAIELNYSKATFFDDIFPSISPVFVRTELTLGELNISMIEFLKNYFSIPTPCYRSSERAGSAFSGDQKLVELCKELKAESFMVKPGTENYHPPEFFNSKGITLETFSSVEKPYKQLHGEFVPGLSALDLAMNCGPSGFLDLYSEIKRRS